MKRELEEKLVAEFPTFFKDYRGDPINSCLAFGLTCSDGWFDLIYQLCKDIQAAGTGKDFNVLQVKEKFGGLRFYVCGANDEIHKLIEAAESKSYKLCEVCGAQGQLTQRNHWLQTLCEIHMKEAGAGPCSENTTKLFVQPLEAGCTQLMDEDS